MSSTWTSVSCIHYPFVTSEIEPFDFSFDVSLVGHPCAQRQFVQKQKDNFKSNFFFSSVFRQLFIWRRPRDGRKVMKNVLQNGLFNLATIICAGKITNAKWKNTHTRKGWEKHLSNMSNVVREAIMGVVKNKVSFFYRVFVHTNTFRSPRVCQLRQWRRRRQTFIRPSTCGRLWSRDYKYE